MNRSRVFQKRSHMNHITVCHKQDRVDKCTLYKMT